MYLVTGGAGFIGSNIARKLVAMGEKVRILDDFSTGKRENLAGLNDIEIIEGSLLDKDCVEIAVDGVHYVLHQAAISSVPRSLAETDLVNEVNVTGTLNLLQALKGKNLKKFVYAASSAVYGNPGNLPIEETFQVEPLSPYAVSKYAGELYCQTFAENFDLPSVSLRYFNVFGPYQDPFSEYAAVIPIFILKMLRDEQPVIFGDGEQTRDFTYIDDVVEANLLACQSEKVGCGEVINIACGEKYSLNQLFATVSEIMNKKIKPIYTDERMGDVRRSMADIKSARELLNYEVKVDFREGLKRTVEWFKINENLK